MKVIDCDQYSPEWWEARKGIATASEASRIVTPAKWAMASAARGYACELVAQHYDYNYGQRDEFATAAMKSGTIMEPHARKYYEFATGTDVRQVGFCLSDCGRFGCSPDGLCGGDGGLELKHPTAATHVRWLYDGVIPQEYLPQIHWSLIVTGRKWWDFMAFYPGLPELLIRVAPDDKTEQLKAAMEAFWLMLCEVRKAVESPAPAQPIVEPQESYF